MIRQDYVLRMIAQFALALAQIRRLRHHGELEEATAALEEEYLRLFGLDSNSLRALSESALFARLVSGDSTHLVREKVLMLVTLFNETAETYLAQDQTQDSRAYYLKALNLLLEVTLREPEPRFPGFVPSIQALTNRLEGWPLPVRTNAALMRHFEQIGAFGKAEDQLFEIIGSEQDNQPVLDLGIEFYQRLLQESDPALQRGNLPRTEVQTGLADLQERRRICCA